MPLREQLKAMVSLAYSKSAIDQFQAKTLLPNRDDHKVLALTTVQRWEASRRLRARFLMDDWYGHRFLASLHALTCLRAKTLDDILADYLDSVSFANRQDDDPEAQALENYLQSLPEYENTSWFYDLVRYDAVVSVGRGPWMRGANDTWALRDGVIFLVADCDVSALHAHFFQDDAGMIDDQGPPLRLQFRIESDEALEYCLSDSEWAVLLKVLEGEEVPADDPLACHLEGEGFLQRL